MVSSLAKLPTRMVPLLMAMNRVTPLVVKRSSISQGFQQLRQGQGLFEFLQIDFIHSFIDLLVRRSFAFDCQGRRRGRVLAANILLR
jgi:hypothetical protein